MPTSFVDRFWSKVAKSDDGCWRWTGAHYKNGYGFIHPPDERMKTNARSTTGAHRFAWELTHRQSIPPGIEVMHACDVRDCVNPAHLRLGTHAENMADMRQKGRAKGGQAPKPTCGRGHPMSGENVATRANGRRECRECRRVRDRKTYKEAA